MKGPATAYRATNPFTEQTIKAFDEHSDAYVEQALARAAALYRLDWCRGDRSPRLAM
ncbi:hypothetical protein [Sphingomonas sp. UV9]|uniref:hypothetical protein n=1 Tax=Sphingomonas sp. UV9 TaxID=1851410 RepID=UPI0019D11E46|nr:hypothetical protein [Sphingomonas sp. UV9]